MSTLRDLRAFVVSLLVGVAPGTVCAQRLDPAAWGSDHVGQVVPAFTSGDECLFCHRMDVGPAWPKNRHGQTVRTADRDAAALESLANLPAGKNLAAEV